MRVREALCDMWAWGLTGVSGDVCSVAKKVRVCLCLRARPSANGMVFSWPSAHGTV